MCKGDAGIMLQPATSPIHPLRQGPQPLPLGLGLQDGAIREGKASEADGTLEESWLGAKIPLPLEIQVHPGAEQCFPGHPGRLCPSALPRESLGWAVGTAHGQPHPARKRPSVCGGVLSSACPSICVCIYTLCMPVGWRGAHHAGLCKSPCVCFGEG